MTNRNINEELDLKDIIVWLDFDAYSYVNFGIVIELKKLIKFNLIGIVATKTDYEFFKNQKIIQFKEIIYLPNFYNKNSKISVEKLAIFEKNYNLNLWLDIFSERYFYKYWKDFHRFSYEEILLIVQNLLEFFDKILEKYQPTIIVMQQAGENISNLLFYKMAKIKEIKIFMPNLVHMKNRIAVSDNLLTEEISNHFKKKDYLNSKNQIVYDEDYINEKNKDVLIPVFDYSYSVNFSQKVNHYLNRFFNSPENIYQNKGRTIFAMMRHRLKRYFAIKNIERFLNKFSLKNIEDENFFYFPLASEPEARILSLSPFYSNQINLIENIAKSIPINSILYVKEHPIQRIKFWRDIKEYKKILAIPNVKLIHPFAKSDELLKNCMAVITISGGTGFDGLFYRKPVFLFSDEFYDVLSTVTKINSISELSKKINDGLKKFSYDEYEMNIFMESFFEQTINVPYHDMIKDGNKISTIQEFEKNTNITSNIFQEFMIKYEDFFKLIAKTILEKL